MPDGNAADRLGDLIGLVARRHGIILERRDPVLIIETMVGTLIEDQEAKIKAVVQDATDQIAAAGAVQVEAAKGIAERLVTQSGAWVKDQVREAMETATADLLRMVSAEREAAQASARKAMWGAVVAAAVAFLSAGALLGYMIAGHL